MSDTFSKKSVVALVKCDSYTETIVSDAVRRGIDLLGGTGLFAQSSERVLLKPNILSATDPLRCAITHPALFGAVAEVFKETGADLRYGDSPGGIQGSFHAMKKTGYDSLARRLSIPLVDFDHGKSVAFPEGITSKRLFIADGVLESDCTISLPKFKTHGLTRFTGAVKNQYGCVPGTVKGQYHARFPDQIEFSRLLADITAFVKPRLYIMDAVYAMEGNGPQSGDPKKLGLILMSADPAALDAVACRLIRLDPRFVPTSTAAAAAGLGTFDENAIDLRGDPFEQFIDDTFKVVRAPVAAMPRSSFLRELKKAITPRPAIKKSLCTRCGKCVQVCPVEPKAIRFQDPERLSPPIYNYGECIRCYCCHEMCPSKAIGISTPLPGRILPVASYLALLFARVHSSRSLPRHE